ncbi:DUF397 domain-containing protein [Streptomyces venezuelae]|uniref:DUF397 domain-containing protein n=1 Tax=Streptomyces venezuelae TaxID=54571 RepID=UPI0036607D0F
MAPSQDLPGARWRKSSYSGNTGGECIECAPLDGATWQKSTYSTAPNDDCIEFAQAQCNGTVAVRDSKNPAGPTLTLTHTAFTHFVDAAASGDLTRPAR